MAILHGLCVFIVLVGIIPICNAINSTEETTVAEMMTEETTVENTMTSNITMTTMAANVTLETQTEMTTMETEEETTETTMETTTMFIPMTSLAPIILTNCTQNSECTADFSVCNQTSGLCQCNNTFVLVNDTECRTEDFFKANIVIENVTDNSILVSWSKPEIWGVDVTYEITFNRTLISNISAPPYLINNLTDGEIHSIQVRSFVRGRDGREVSVLSEVKYVRTAPKAPTFNDTRPYMAPNITVMWTPRNPDADIYYVTLMGPGKTDTISTNETTYTFDDLKPGINYMVTVIQQTSGPYASNSSEAVLNVRTESAEPDPPMAVDLVDVGQRNITLNVTDTDMANGNITGYVFNIMYKRYPDEVLYREMVDFLHKRMPSIYVLQKHIHPGAQYRIAVFTTNDKFNSSANVTVENITTLADRPGSVNRRDNSFINTTSVVLRWDRPAMPNGNMEAYSVVLESRPGITDCRIYYLCIGACNDAILGPPNNTCSTMNDTSLTRNQKEISLQVDSLRVGTNYKFRIIGHNEAGSGDPLSVDVKTRSIIPDAVDNASFKVTHPNGGTLVTWSAPSFAGEDLIYDVTLKDAFYDSVKENRETTGTSYSPRPSLYNYYNYTVTVTAKTTAGHANNQSFLFTTPANGRLGSPVNVKTLLVDCNTVQISWSEPSIRDRNGPITSYVFENTIGTDRWTYEISNPDFWAVASKRFTHQLNVLENAVYSIQIYAKNDNRNPDGTEYRINKFKTNLCPKSNTTEIVLIVFAFLILLGVCLAIIVYVYRRKVREIEEAYNPNHNPRPITIDNGPTTIIEEEIELNRPFILAEAQKSFEEKSADSNRLFLLEYDDIKKLSQIEGRKRSTSAATLDANKAKNRYVNILSYDHSRVKLRPMEDDPGSDYINANYIVGYTYEREYVASQGPLPGTVNDFWRMTWEQSVTIIVMLTKCKEGNTDKCEHYWPDTVNEPKQYGDIVVNLISVSNMDKFDINIFQVSQGDYTRTIKHFHFLEWPDFSAAVDSTVVIDFIQTVRTHITPEVKGPILIHCSAGVGRTGTYISIDYLLQYVRDHDLSQPVDIFAWVVQMRKHRVSMVQVDKQYIFIHRALTELVDRKRNGLLQSQDDSNITNEIVYENTAFQSDDDEEEEEVEDEDEEADSFYENAMKKDQHITEL